MSINISNPSADRNEKIANAAKVLGKSDDRRAVFSAIYRGKQKIKTVSELAFMSKLKEIRVLQEGGKLAAEDIIKQVKLNRKTAYQKIDFYTHNKTQIIRLSKNPKKIDKLPTRSNPQIKIETIHVDFPKKLVAIKQVTIDDIDSFSKVRKISGFSIVSTPLYEATIKKGLKKIIGEPGSFKDWGGETNDLYSTRVRLNKNRIATAFGLKGKGTKGKLTPGKMGANGDQIQRLFRTPAELLLVQYCGQIDESVVEQMKKLAIAKSFMENRKIYFGIIDGKDTSRLVKAYPQHFS